jgi:ABC-type transport system involved in multi-copper enzyme maturation permease subunit
MNKVMTTLPDDVSARASTTTLLGSRQAVGTIAVRELTDDLTSVRFLIITLLVIVLTPLAVYVGTRDYRNRLEDYNRLMVEQQGLAAGPAGKQVSGSRNLEVLRAIRPPERLSVLARGVDGVLPEYWDFSPTGIQVGPLASRPQRLGDVLGQLDLEFLIRVVLGLLAILLAFDAVVGEKELGTLRMVLSQPLSRASFLTGKLIGGAITLLVPLAATFLLALLSAQVFSFNLLAQDSLPQVGTLAVVSAIYLLCMYALGLVISSLTASQKTSLVVLLVIWVLVVLAIPPLSTLVAQAISPTPPAHTVYAKKRTLDDDIRRHAELAMGDVFREETGQDRMVGMGIYHKHKEAIDRRIDPIVVSYVNKRRQLLDELDRDVERRMIHQNEVARTIMALSPAASFAAATTDLAGTGDTCAEAWLEAIRRQQSQLNVALFDDPPWVQMRMGAMSMSLDRHPAPSLQDLPTCAPPRRGVRAALARSLPRLGLLILYTGLLVIGSFVAFSRYDVR